MGVTLANPSPVRVREEGRIESPVADPISAAVGKGTTLDERVAIFRSSAVLLSLNASSFDGLPPSPERDLAKKELRQLSERFQGYRFNPSYNLLVGGAPGPEESLALGSVQTALVAAHDRTIDLRDAGQRSSQFVAIQHARSSLLNAPPSTERARSLFDLAQSEVRLLTIEGALDEKRLPQLVAARQRLEQDAVASGEDRKLINAILLGARVSEAEIFLQHSRGVEAREKIRDAVRQYPEAAKGLEGTIRDRLSDPERGDRAAAGLKGLLIALGGGGVEDLLVGGTPGAVAGAVVGGVTTSASGPGVVGGVVGGAIIGGMAGTSLASVIRNRERIADGFQSGLSPHSSSDVALASLNVLALGAPVLGSTRFALMLGPGKAATEKALRAVSVASRGDEFVLLPERLAGTNTLPREFVEAYGSNAPRIAQRLQTLVERGTNQITSNELRGIVQTEASRSLQRALSVYLGVDLSARVSLGANTFLKQSNAIESGTLSEAERRVAKEELYRSTVIGAALLGLPLAALGVSRGAQRGTATLRPPTALARQEVQAVQRMTAAGFSADDARALFPGVETDPVTGLATNTYRTKVVGDAIRNTRDYGAKYLNAHVEISNLGGLNSVLGHAGADEVLLKISGTFRDELTKAGVPFAGFRVGGPRIQFLLSGVNEEGVRRALSSAQTRANAYLEESGLALLNHPKPGAAPGVRIDLGIESIQRGDNLRSLLTRTDGVLESVKAVSARTARQRAQDVGVQLEVELPRTPSPRAEVSRARVEVLREESNLTAFDPQTRRAAEFKSRIRARTGRETSLEEAGALRGGEEEIRDQLTGLYNGTERVPTLQRLQSTPLSYGPITYVEFDVSNLGRMPKALGNDALRVFSALLRKHFPESAAQGPYAVPFRHGGDEFSAAIVGLQKEEVIQRVGRIEGEFSAWTRENFAEFDGVRYRLDKLPHSKEGRAPGVGVTGAAVEIPRQGSLYPIFQEADRLIEKTRNMRQANLPR